MALTYCNTKQVWELLGLPREHYVTNEAVGTGDGSTTEFDLDHQNIIADTYTIYKNGTAMTEITDYTIDKTNGKITFTTAPTGSDTITATYMFGFLPDSTVSDIIERKQDYIDSEINHAYRTVKVTNEMYDIGTNVYDVNLGGTPIYLKHRKIKTFSHSDGDKLEVWNGSTYEDYLTTKTEGRADDFWVDYEQGISYLQTYPYNNPDLSRLRLTYRYGETNVKKDIQDACIKLTAIDILMTDDYNMVVPEGSNGSGAMSKIDRWKKDAMQIIQSNREISIVY